MNGLPYYKAYPRDFIEGTIGMPFEVKCAYRVVLDLVYMQGGNLPDDPRYISGLLGCSIRKWKTIRDELVQTGKLIVSGEFLTNYRAVSELETLAKHQQKQAENASGPRKNKDLQKPRQNHTEPEPEPKKETPKGVSGKRATRLPEDWEPDRVFATREGLPPAEINLEADKFRDYWRALPGQKGVKADWPATWRNWVRRAAESRPQQRTTASWRDEPEYRNVL